MKRATTKQVHRAVRAAAAIVGEVVYGQWCERPYRSQFESEERKRKRYLGYKVSWLHNNSKQRIIDEANFLLWMQGVTADLRVTKQYIRATADIA